MTNADRSGRSLRIALFAIAVLLTGACTGAEGPRPDAAQARHLYDAGTQFVDVRTGAEWSAGHLKNALHLPVDLVDARAAALLPHKDTPLVLYCGSGVRAQRAAQELRQLGYTHVTAMTGGYQDLKAAGYPIVDHP